MNTPKNTDKNGLLRDNQGRFLEGNTGKPKGAINRTTKDLKQMIVNFVNDKEKELHEIWNSLDNREKATLFVHLAKMVIPQKQELTTEEIIKQPPQIFVQDQETKEALLELKKRFEME